MRLGRVPTCAALPFGVIADVHNAAHAVVINSNKCHITHTARQCPPEQVLYAIEGERLQVAFVDETGGEGAVVINDLRQGDASFSPQGSIHYQQNLDCMPATFLAALTSEDPATVTITGRLLVELASEAIQVNLAVFCTVRLSVDVLSVGVVGCRKLLAGKRLFFSRTSPFTHIKVLL